jgi:hypothetical protein
MRAQENYKMLKHRKEFDGGGDPQNVINWVEGRPAVTAFGLVSPNGLLSKDGTERL